jgi:hypothetical protein
MHISVEASLKKLRTTYIDILYMHWWDWDTGVEEVMNGLHNLVVQGKVLYLVGLLSFSNCSSCDIPTRAFRIPLRGWLHKLINMLVTTERHLSSFTRAGGTSLRDPSNARSSRWRARMVSRNLNNFISFI